ncbi:hypothetical protein OM416_19885 [Paenibacillus sp. LS1]|uniref:hypothetical protein n=1 Tax=Paenibacillus sp. LS1 TaxID=2992120 RepID=UPI0022309975|nr:hypothetical protein [Paenibacillus sp. LS1]MCW3793857.1 hypothetical protein [Paenibacillus sp. LS1]
MTLIIGIKDGNRGCLISDFRITNVRTGDQSDIAMKYISFDDRLFLTMAGKTVTLLPQIQEQLPSIMRTLTFENVDDEEGPLKNVLDIVFRGKPASYDSPMIGVYLDHGSNSFKMFRIDTRFEHSNSTWSFSYVRDADFESEIIGSGEILSLSEFFPSFGPIGLYNQFSRGLSLRYSNTKKAINENNTYDISTITNAIIFNVKTRLRSLGPSVYRLLGISPVLMPVIIENAHLRIEASEYETGYFNNQGEYKLANYSIERRREGEAILIDHDTGTRIPVYPTNSDFSPSNNQNVTFDPENLTAGDEYRYFPFTIKQVRTHSSIIRSITMTTYLPYGNNEFPVREVIKRQTLSTNIFDTSPVPETPLLTSVEITEWNQVDLFNTAWLEEKLGPASNLFRIENTPS